MTRYFDYHPSARWIVASFVFTSSSMIICTKPGIKIKRVYEWGMQRYTGIIYIMVSPTVACVWVSTVWRVSYVPCEALSRFSVRAGSTAWCSVSIGICWSLEVSLKKRQNEVLTNENTSIQQKAQHGWKEKKMYVKSQNLSRSSMRASSTAWCSVAIGICWSLEVSLKKRQNKVLTDENSKSIDSMDGKRGTCVSQVKISLDSACVPAPLRGVPYR